MKYFNIALVKVIVVASCLVISWMTHRANRYDRKRHYEWS
jgi:hypothetical protein